MTETTSAPAPAVSEAVQPFLEGTTTLLRGLTEQANELAGKAERVENKSKMVFEYRDDTDTTDETIKGYQNWFDAVQNKILEQQREVETYIRNKYFSGEDAEEYNAEETASNYKALVAQIKAAIDLLTTLNGGVTPAMDLPELVKLPGTRAKSAATGIKRPRFNSVQYRKAGESSWTLAEMKKAGSDETTSNLTALVNILKAKHKGTDIDSAKIQNALSEEVASNHGGKELSDLADQEIVFAINVNTGDNESQNYEVQVIPKAR